MRIVYFDYFALVKPMIYRIAKVPIRVCSRLALPLASKPDRSVNFGNRSNFIQSFWWPNLGFISKIGIHIFGKSYGC